MDKRDARLLGQQAQEEVRRQAIKLLKKGMKQVEVAAQLEVSRQHVGYWWKRYRQGGWNALKMRRRGRAFGAKRKLSAEQEKEVQKLISDKTPDQLKMKYALWTREAVRELIAERYGVRYALQSLSVVLKRWGFTPQRPLKRAYEQRPAEVKCWLQEEYPHIRPPFSPSLALSDFVSFTADEPALSYSVSFGAPVTDPVIHFGSLASTLTFNGGIALTKVSGQSEFAVSGSTVTGNILDGVTPNDANGTILLNGTFSSFSFQAEKLPAVFSGDGINLQIGAAAIPEPGLSGFGAACLVLLAALLGRSRSSFLNRF